MSWVRIPLRRCVLDTTFCYKACQWLAAGRWFSLVSSTSKTDLHDITEILLKVPLSTITLTPLKFIYEIGFYIWIYTYINLPFYMHCAFLQSYLRNGSIGGVTVSVLVSSAVSRWFESQSGQMKDSKIDIVLLLH
jgi:hypothetical protein